MSKQMAKLWPNETFQTIWINLKRRERKKKISWWQEQQCDGVDFFTNILIIVYVCVFSVLLSFLYPLEWFKKWGYHWNIFSLWFFLLLLLISSHKVTVSTIHVTQKNKEWTRTTTTIRKKETQMRAHTEVAIKKKKYFFLVVMLVFVVHVCLLWKIVKY